MLVVVYIATFKRRPAKSFRPRQHVVGIPNQNESFAQDSNINANVSNPHKPQHQYHHQRHRRHLVYYLDGDRSHPFIGLKNIFGRHPGSSSFSSDSSSGSLAISPSHPAIFGGGKDIEMSVKVKFVLTPPTPSRASRNPRELRASTVDSEDST